MSQVSFIVVNYNGGKIVGACLEALLRQSYEAREVIVVDNNSCDGSLNEIQRIMKKDSTDSLKLISLNENIGFAGANLEGLKYSKWGDMGSGNCNKVFYLPFLDHIFLQPLQKSLPTSLLLAYTGEKPKGGDKFSPFLKGDAVVQSQTMASEDEGRFWVVGCLDRASFSKT